jgi:hypothetical protein
MKCLSYCLSHKEMLSLKVSDCDLLIQLLTMYEYVRREQHDVGGRAPPAFYFIIQFY